MKIVERLLREGEARQGAVAGDLGPDDARALLGSWLSTVGAAADGRELLARLQTGEFTHRDLYRRARAVHEHRLAEAVDGLDAVARGDAPLDLTGMGLRLFESCIPAIPYAAATAFLAGEKRRLTRSDGEPPRVALVADGLDAMHGVSAAVRQIRERGARGFEVEVVGTDAMCDRRLSAVASIDVPFYDGLRLGVPALPAIVETLSDGRYDLVHICTPGPAGIMASLIAHTLGMALVGSYHTELASYAGVRSGRPELEFIVSAGLRMFYGACELVLSPSPATDARLLELGVSAQRVARWDRGVDLTRFRPSLRESGHLPGTINVLYAGRLAREKGIDLLVDAFQSARTHEPRLHLVLAGVGPEEEMLRSRLGSSATFLGWLRGDELARTYASADAFLFASTTDTFGQVILEAQASGLPVVAANQGGPASLIEHGQSGLLAPPDPDGLADALLSVTGGALLRERLRRGGLAAVRERSWETALDRLATGYRQALAAADARRAREIA
jgi:glycosyltransferase involved in cell wall biosynthesis